jgi:hypothetical protein
MNSEAIFEWVKDPKAYLIPIGDTHIGDRCFTEYAQRKLRGYIEWVKNNKNARVILMGDIFNVATRTSKTSPFQTMSLKEEMDFALKLFEPIKKQIIVALDGNHENRATDFMDYSPMIPFCHALGIRYGGYSSVVKLSVGKTNKGDDGKGSKYIRPAVNYIIYAHHTSGGGNTVGGRINRVDRMRQIFANADVYLGAHNHGLINAPIDIFFCDTNTLKVSRQRQHLVDCGSYVDWNNSYAERLMFCPSKLGSPKIEFGSAGRKKDIHVSN